MASETQYTRLFQPLPEEVLKEVDRLNTPPPFPTMCMSSEDAHAFFKWFTEVEREIYNLIVYGEANAGECREDA